MPRRKKPAPKEVDRSSPVSSIRHMTVATLVLALITGCLLSVYWNSAFSSLPFSSYTTKSVPYSTKNVTRYVMPFNTSFMEIAEWRIPVILTKTIADKWIARKIFTTSFLSNRLSQVAVYYQEHKRTFITFHDNKPLESMVLDEKWEHYNLKINITIPKLLGWDKPDLSPDIGPWYYFSQDVLKLRSTFPDILQYIQPINDLILSEDNVQINLWVGREGIITHTHYDASYNFFVQLQGKKRFTLFPSNQTMYLYPCLHPHYGHSQVDILNVNLTTYPLFNGSEALVAEVSPGDMLVVPPYWYHHVETLEESVSINVWSDAPEYAIMNKIYSKPVPFKEDWEWTELVIATHIYARMIIDTVGIEDSLHFVHNLVTQRYLPLILRHNIKLNMTCYHEVNHLLSNTNWYQKEIQYGSLLKKGVIILSHLFKDIPIEATIRICVANYLEHLVHRVVGLEYVCPFLSVLAGISEEELYQRLRDSD